MTSFFVDLQHNEVYTHSHSKLLKNPGGRFLFFPKEGIVVQSHFRLFKMRKCFDTIKFKERNTVHRQPRNTST